MSRITDQGIKTIDPMISDRIQGVHRLGLRSEGDG